MTLDELYKGIGESECRIAAYKHAFLTQNNEAGKRAIVKAKEEERAEILAALHTALYMIPADAPTYAGLIQAVDIINTRGSNCL